MDDDVAAAAEIMAKAMALDDIVVVLMVVVDILCSLLKAGSVRWVYWSCVLWRHLTGAMLHKNRTSSCFVLAGSWRVKRSAKVPKELQLFGRQLTEGYSKKRLLLLNQVTLCTKLFTYWGINCTERENSNLFCNARCPTRFPNKMSLKCVDNDDAIKSVLCNMAHIQNASASGAQVNKAKQGTRKITPFILDWCWLRVSERAR